MIAKRRVVATVMGFTIVLFLTTKSWTQEITARASIDLDSLATALAGEGGGGYAKAERLLRRLSVEFSWLSTDYKKRSVQEIIQRRGGNCFELAVVFMDLIDRLGVRYRQIAEVNIHPITPRRQESAERRVREAGLRASVFGLQHNDHRWVEIYDERTEKWIPADPSMGVIGHEEWMRARVWFGERRTLDTSITNNMLVPVGIFVVGDDNRFTEDRSEHYLLNSFDALYGGKLSELDEWNEWRDAVRALSPEIRAAFLGQKNLHDQRERIAKTWEIYQRLRDEYRGKKE